MATYTIFARDNASGHVSAWMYLFSTSTTSASAANTGPATSGNGNNSQNVGGFQFDYMNFGDYYHVATSSKGDFDYWQSNEAFLEFDTSSSNIPSSETITGVQLVINVNRNSLSGTKTTVAQVRQYAYNHNATSSVLSDYRTPTQLSAATVLASASMPYVSSGSQVYSKTLTENGSNFSSAINRSGFTQIVLATDQQAANTTFSSDPTTYQYYQIISPNSVSSTTSAAQRPNIVVTTSAGASPQTVTPSGIATAEAIGSHTVSVASPPASPQTVSPTGIATREAFGNPLVSVAGAPQTILLAGSGIPTGEAFGIATVSGGAAAGQQVIGGLLVKVLQNGTWVASNGASISVKRITTADSPYQAKPYQVVYADASNGPITVLAPGHGNGIGFTAKKGDPSANAVTVTGNSFDGAGSFQITAQGKSQDFLSDGAVWLLV